MAKKFRVETSPDQVARDSEDLSFYLKRATESGVNLDILRTEWQATDPLDLKVLELRSNIQGHNSKSIGAEYKVTEILKRYGSNLIVSGPSSQFSPSLGLPETFAEDDPETPLLTARGIVNGINYKKARIELATDDGRLNVIYAIIESNPEYTYPVVALAVKVEVPTVYDTLRHPGQVQ